MSALTSRVLRALSMALMLVVSRSLIDARMPRAHVTPPDDLSAGRGVRLRRASGGATVVEAPPRPHVEEPLRVPTAPAPGRSRLRDRLRPRRADLFLMVALSVVLGAIHMWGMGRYPAFFDDEGTYVSQAWAIDTQGVLAPYTYWYDHPPLGWIALAGWAQLVPMSGADLHAVAAGRLFMAVVFMVSACLLYAAARRLGLGRPFAALAVILFGLSPLAVHYQRMVLLDNIAVAWLLAAVVLALSPRRRLWAFAGSGICLAAACLTKETFVLFAPAVLLLLWQGAQGPTRRFAVAVFSSLLVLALAFYPLFALLRGELFAGADHTSLVDGIRFQLSREGSGSLLDPDSGSRKLIDSWLSLDGIVLTLAALALPLGLCVRRLRPIAIALLIPVLMAARPGTYLPAMFIIGLLPFAALLVAGAVQWLWPTEAAGDRLERVGERWRGAAAIAPPIVLALGAVVLAAVAIPAWSGGLATATSDDLNRPYREAVAWLEENADRESTILVDNTVWTDLVERGFAQERVVWFYKLDLDPAVPIPWERFDYVVRTNLLAGQLVRLPRTREVVDNSVPVVRFASGPETVEILRVVRDEAVRG